MNKTGNPLFSARPIVSKFLVLAITLALIAALGVAQAQAISTTVIENVRIPIDLFVYVPCAAGGTGEFVLLSGPLHILFTTTIDDQGGYHSKFHNQPQGISGTGFTTGDKYQATGVTQGTFNGKIGYENTYVNNFRIIGQGAGNNFLVHETFHITVNPSGQVTAFVDHFSIECRVVPSYPG
jgi:hypothetical protein